MNNMNLSATPMLAALWPDDQDFDYLEPGSALPDKLFPAFQDKRTLIIPRLQTMDDYIRLHYSESIANRLCDWIARGWVKTDVGHGARGLPHTVTLGSMKFWRESRTSLLADIRVSIIVKSTIDRDEYDEHQYIVQLGFCMDEYITCTTSSFCVSMQEPDHSYHWPLSEYLIPHFKKTDVERYAQELLQFRLHEGWLDQHYNNAYELASRLGLTIVQHRLHGYGNTRSVLFFHKGTITVYVQDKDTGVGRKKIISIPANTIVINEVAVRNTSVVIDIYHECIHWEWHYLFYRLQDMHNDDLRQIRKEYRIRYDHGGERDPLSWMEWQARQGSMSLWMPRVFMQKQINIIKHTMPGMSCHLGARLDYIGRSIAMDYSIPKYRVRARLINMGFVEAKGALNYLDDHYVRPFCFSRSSNNGNYTFFITSKEFSKLYQDDLSFQRLIDTGDFVYAEGHVCWADPQYIIKTSSGPCLTEWANAHVDKCCLRFVEIYEQDETLAYRFGRLNSDESFNNHFYQYPGCADLSALTGEQKDQLLRDYIDALPRSFPKMLTKFMTDAKMTEEALIRATGLSESTVTRLRNSTKENYKVDQIVALIAVFQLPPLVSVVFLQSAGIDINGNSQNSRYALVVYTLYQYPVNKIQNMLDSMGFPRLKLSDDNDDQQRVS